MDLRWLTYCHLYNIIILVVCRSRGKLSIYIAKVLYVCMYGDHVTDHEAILKRPHKKNRLLLRLFC